MSRARFGPIVELLSQLRQRRKRCTRAERDREAARALRALVRRRQPAPLRGRGDRSGRRARGRGRRCARRRPADARAGRAQARRHERRRDPHALSRGEHGRYVYRASSPGCTRSRRPRCGSPASTALQKPLLHLHTQFNRDLPWAEIDMDFMNLNQSAHGDREFGYLRDPDAACARKTVVGPLAGSGRLARIGGWSRAACGWHEAQDLDGRAVRRQHAQRRRHRRRQGRGAAAARDLGQWLRRRRARRRGRRASPADAVDALLAEYEASYELAPELRAGGARRRSLVDAARIEAGLRTFLERRRLRRLHRLPSRISHGLRQLPGIAVAAADGRRATASAPRATGRPPRSLRIVKVMAAGLRGGTSFMEDYTYHFAPADRRSSARTCSRSARRSPRTGRPARSTRCRSAGARTPSGSCSPPRRARGRRRPARPGWPLPPGRKRGRRRRAPERRSRGSRLHARSGSPGRTSRPPPRHG